MKNDTAPFLPLFDQNFAKEQTPAEAVENYRVLKRDGRICDWDRSRIIRALGLAYQNTPGYQGSDSGDKISRLAEGIEWAVWHRSQPDAPISIDAIQDITETCLAAAGDWEVARCYVRYRTKRDSLRPRRYEENGLQDYIAVSRYARYRDDLQRREVWPETVERVRDMHLRRFASKAACMPNEHDRKCAIDAVGIDAVAEKHLMFDRSLFEEIWEVFESIKKRRILPSMRSLQFGGLAIESNEARMYNCSYSYANRVAFFRECFYLLLSGVGVGFSVQKQHIAELPPLPDRLAVMDLPVRHIAIADTIEGWSDALDHLFRSHYEGWLAEFAYTQIRNKGAVLRTSGGKAPGHLPLKRSLDDISVILTNAAGRHLRPIEVYDIVMITARAVLAGGIRRSATLCLFSADDDEMATAKSGDWFTRYPHRAYSNNSAVLVRERTDRAVFDKLFGKIREFGEPGFYFTEDEEYGANPCVEIGLCPSAKLSSKDVVHLRKLDPKQDWKEGERVTGWQMCNLTTINGAFLQTPEEFYKACREASLVGTLQACYSKIDYLGPVTRFLNEREALLGVSICGILDRPDILLDTEVLERGAKIVRATNHAFASFLGIRPAARTTCVKPEGTASLLLGSGSGIHPHHAKRYFRRVQVNRTDPVYRHFAVNNKHLTEKSIYNPDTDDVITFPVEAPAGALCKDDIDALSFLEKVRLVQRHWVCNGSSPETPNPGLYHNVSNTVTVRDGEWEAVSDFIWQHRNDFTGVALLSDCGDKTYRQAPREALDGSADVVRWNELEYVPVDYAMLREGHDQTKLADVAACAGGACELV